ncbi:MAG: hypothetical protein ACI4TK_12855 [Agathobacter sp.]
MQDLRGLFLPVFSTAQLKKRFVYQSGYFANDVPAMEKQAELYVIEGNSQEE